MTKFYGHSLPDTKDQANWEPLEDHLNLVTKYAREFAEKMHASDWAELLGYWHDLGKYDLRFQNYLLTENGFQAHLEATGSGRVNHSSFGGQHAVDQFQGKENVFGYLLAYGIMGHHAGLPDYRDQNSDAAHASSLVKRLADQQTRITLHQIPASIHQKRSLKLPPLQFLKERQPLCFQLAFFTRMLFSCLVDADYLATEAFMSPDQAELRPQRFTEWEQLSTTLLELLQNKAQGPTTPLGQLRQHILQNCLLAADKRPGFYSLTVPTGGGKTYSSLAFALQHLQKHQKERIIYAIPFTSIVEQTASVFRDLMQELPEETLIEHHYNIDPEQETYASRLATENWDAPLIVTTNVQLLESLFAARPARCRKLHRLINSVIILDEAQTLPIEFLQPCLAALQELVTNYGCTIVLCTATQPAIHFSQTFPIGLKDVQEIIPDPAALAKQMQRVAVIHRGPVTMSELAQELQQREQFLCIVNYKADAANLYRAVAERTTDSTGLFHLSTNLCPEHRFQKLRQIRQRLQQGRPCQVISTQLIEAGVDVDFPVVYRSLAGLDSIAQAAGRCNREGKISSAPVYVFEPCGQEWSSPKGYQKRCIGISEQLLRHADSPLNKHGWLSTEAITAFFEQNYWTHNDLWDQQRILSSEMLTLSASGIPEFQFRQIAKNFRLIDDYQIPVFVRFNKKAIRLLERLRTNLQQADQKTAGLARRKLLRQLQRYSVGVSARVLQAKLGSDLSVLSDRFDQPTEYYELLNDNCYHEELGFIADEGGILNSSQTVF